VLGSGLLVIACLYTEYYPVLNGRIALSDTQFRLQNREYLAAENSALATVKADTLWPEPWRLLADLRFSRWQATGAEKDWKAFVEVADTLKRLDPRHHLAWFTRGNWYLAAWRKSGRRELLDEAIAAYSQASQSYPNRAFYHAQLAWAHHLAGQADEAHREADRAIELDQQMPHKEQKLSRQHVADSLKEGDKLLSRREETAEQTVQRLRTASAEDKQ
jgi:tetratricopeptide (TPR) repeat protein